METLATVFYNRANKHEVASLQRVLAITKNGGVL